MLHHFRNYPMLLMVETMDRIIQIEIITETIESRLYSITYDKVIPVSL